MLVRKGVAAVDKTLPWQCSWVPFYAAANPDLCQYAVSPNAPAAPVVPAGSLNPNQGATIPGSVDQVVDDTAVVQRQQAQDFFTTVAENLGLKDPAADCDPSAFWCNYKNLVILGALFVGGLVVVNLAKGVTR